MQKDVPLSPNEEICRISLGTKGKIFFLDSLASLVSAGIPIVRALQILYFQSENKKLRAVAKFLKAELERGLTITLAAGKMHGIFSSFDRSLIEMGEATGKIGGSFETIVEREEKNLELVRKVKQAMIYPIAIVFVAITMVSVIMVYVIPKIEWVYRDSNAALPALTKGVIAFSRFVRSEGIFIILAVVAMGIGFTFLLKNPKFKYQIDLFVLRIPIFGKLLHKKLLITFSSFLSSLLSSGITINKALGIVSEAMSNSVYKREVERVSEEVRNGKSLSSSVGGEYTERRIRGDVISAEETAFYARKLECFPIELSMAIKVGEQTGSLATMLKKTGDRYDREIDSLIKNLSSMLEPIIILFIGSVVGVIVLAVMMPFFNMANVIH